MKSRDKTIREGRCRRLSGRVCALLILMSLGCARPSSYPQSNQPLQQKDETHIQALEEAVVLARKKGDHRAARQYADRLQAVKLEAAGEYYRKAKHYYSQADLNAAHLCIHHAIRYQPDARRNYDLKNRIESDMAQAEQRRAEALTLADRFQWHEARALLKQARQQHRSLARVDQDLQQLKERAYQYYIDAAEKRLHLDDWDGAVRQANQALTFQAQGAEAERLLKIVEDRRRTQQLIDRVRHQLARDDPEQAMALLEQETTLHVSSPELDELRQQTKTTLCGRWMSQAQEALHHQDAATALALFLRSRQLTPDNECLDEEIAKTKTLLSRDHLRQAQDFLHQGLSGTALLHAAAAVAYSDESADTLDLLEKSINQTQRAVQLTVAFGGFDAQPEHQDIANKLNASVSDRLNQFNLTGLYFKTDVADARLVVSGRMTEARLFRQRTVSARGTSRYEVGLRPKPNPEYTVARLAADAAAAALDTAREQLLTAQKRQTLYAHPDPNDSQAVQRKRRAEAEVIEAQRRLETAVAQSESASTRLKNTRAEVLVPHFTTHEYPIYTIEKTAEITCLIEVIDRHAQRVLLTEQIDGQYTVSDEVVEAESSKNVTADPLELPEDRVVYEGAITALAARLRPLLRKAVRQHSDQFVAAYRRDDSAGQQPGALDNAVKYLFAHPTRNDITEDMLAFIRAYLGKEDTLLDIKGLLQIYGHVLKPSMAQP